MVKYVPFYYHDFLNDPRLLQFEPREQQQWLFLLVSMMKTEGILPDDAKLVGRILDISPASAKQFIIKLKNTGFLVANDTGQKLFTLSSPRLSLEYERSKYKCDEKTRINKERAHKRWHDVEAPSGSS